MANPLHSWINNPRKASLLAMLCGAILVLGQVFLLAHQYQHHQAGQSCQICVSASQIGHAVTPSVPLLPGTLKATTYQLSPLSTRVVSLRWEAPRVRGPPAPFSLFK